MDNNKRLKVGFISSFPLAKTGFSRSAKAFLPILFRKNKWNIFYLNQCMPPNHPDFQKLPWVNDGVFKNFDQNRMNQDQGYARFVSYGNCAVEEFVTKNKLDVCFHIEDIWSSSIDAYLKTEWFKHIKNNFVQWSTADSLPLLPDFLEWAKSGCHMWFWSSFAEREIKKIDNKLFSHCKTLHGAINIEEFKPLSQKEKTELRHKFNIKDDEKICIYLSRNQLRKQFWALLEALRDFRKLYPNKKLRLLFHCKWNEPGGWPLDRIREECGLKKEDVLTTYFCRNCQDWNVQSYEGEDLDCKCCNGQKTRITAGVDSTINEVDLNKIYNLADGSASLPTSAGLELCHCESLLAGIPLGTVPYAGAEEFTPNNFVFKINGYFTRECGTSFRKFVPNISSVVEFLKYIHDLPQPKRENIINEGREWCIKEFDANIIAFKIEQFLDSCQPIDWQPYFDKKKELKDPNAPIDINIEDDYEFIFSSYEKVLNMWDMRDKSKPEIIHWWNFLNQ